jgi:hypothetical protein
MDISAPHVKNLNLNVTNSKTNTISSRDPICAHDHNECNEIPTEINGKPVMRGWKQAGGKPKNFQIIHHKIYKLVECQYGYVLLCIHDICKKIATGDLKCKSHREGKEVYTVCRDRNCTRLPYYGYEYKKPLFCNNHKMPDMIDVQHDRCEYPGCLVHPHYGYEGYPARFCATHKLEGMINVRSKQCEYPGCHIQPYFGYEGHPYRFCDEHKLEGMINVRSKRCQHPGCPILSSFGYEGYPAVFCDKHKLVGMINVHHKQCEFPECTRRSCFGYAGQPSQFCTEHKIAGMINVTDKLCEFPGCPIYPKFGYEGYPPRFCVEHKLEEMINVNCKRCDFLDCNVIAIFGYKGQGAQFCDNHKLEGMINVVRKPCRFPGCTTTPCYGKLYSKTRIFCLEHATLNDYSGDKLHPICQVLNCQNDAYFIDSTDVNLYPIRCHDHRHLTDIELTSKICPNCQEKLYFPENREVCMNCGGFRVKILHKFKETIAKHFLISNNIQFTHNKRITPSGSRYQPDFIIIGKFGVIILEIDEDQHKQSNYTNEDDRMRTIYQDAQLVRPNAQVLFIRFNPDEYTGLQQNLRERYKYLYTIIVYFINLSSIGMPLGELKLYYDEFDGNPIIRNLL